MLTCFEVASSSMNPDPEPVHDGPIQVFIMCGQPACESAVFMVPHLTSLALHAPGCAYTCSGQADEPLRAQCVCGHADLFCR